MTFPVRGYPLGALFVLVTVCAVLVAGVTPLVRMTHEGHVESVEFLAGTACAMLMAGVVLLVLE